MFRTFDLYKLAAQKMIDDNFIIFDTETTGIGAEDEIVELGIIDCRGNVLYDGMFKPTQPMNPAASKVSGITDEMLADKPSFEDWFGYIVELMAGAGVIAFNESFDERMLYQTANKYGLHAEWLDKVFKRSYCAQQLYDRYIGYDKTKLELACEVEGIRKVQTHRATDDCFMTLELLKRIADPERVPDFDRYCAVRAKATGKTVEEVARPLGPLGSYKQKDPAYAECAKLFNEGKSPSEIAELRRVQLRTVEENLVEAFKNDLIPSIDFMIQPEYESGIRAVVQKPDWNGRFTSVKNVMPEDCTWSCIRAVVAKVKKENEERPPAEWLQEVSDGEQPPLEWLVQSASAVLDAQIFEQQDFLSEGLNRAGFAQTEIVK